MLSPRVGGVRKMTFSTPSDRRRQLILERKRLAEALMRHAVHETLEHQLLLAIRDLDEALEWLDQDNIDHRPFILRIVDMELELAMARLIAVQQALEMYGLDAHSLT
jgi:hypothetical protein